MDPESGFAGIRISKDRRVLPNKVRISPDEWIHIFPTLRGPVEDLIVFSMLRNDVPENRIQIIPPTRIIVLVEFVQEDMCAVYAQ